VYGGYFSSNASTIPWALKTGNLVIRPHSVVHSIIYDETKGKATGVRIIDGETKEMIEFYANVIFVNASALNSNDILLNSISNRFPNGLGNDNGLLGKYISWHNYRGKANAQYDGFKNKATDGRSPSYSYMPRFRNVFKQEMNFLRGYAIGVAGGRGTSINEDLMGDELRENLLHPPLGNWYISNWMMGETVPLEKNHVRLHKDLKDKYGIPQLIVSCEWSENDDKMVEDYIEQSKEMFERAGFINIKAEDTKSPPGADIHEMGGVRMGNDPKTSLLDKWNQLHYCKNVFVTDGACMTSTGTQNPTLTFMAITARAANHAIEELKKGNISKP
jgi:choline dehydrogenase-like flavoprotein